MLFLVLIWAENWMIHGISYSTLTLILLIYSTWTEILEGLALFIHLKLSTEYSLNKDDKLFYLDFIES
jgi:hypothetical protein